MTATALPGVTARQAGNRLSAFGLEVECDWRLPGSMPVAGTRSHAEASTHVRLVSRERLDAEWGKAAERVYAPEYADGRVHFTVNRDSDHYRLWFDGYGRYLVAVDGSRIDCERDGVSRDRQARFVFAQALPLAAALQGLDLFHASAVCGGGGVAAFLGGSGVGKTSLASRLMLRGAGFVTDDVLAVEALSEMPLVHPGPPFMAIPNEDHALLDDRFSVLGPAVGNTDKLHASPRSLSHPMPLRAVFYLEPGSQSHLEGLEDGSARRILASAFAPYLMTPDRLRRHLEVAQRVSSNVRQFRLQLPRARRFTAVLEAVEAVLLELAI